MAKIKIKLKDKKTNKIVTELDWPVSPMKVINNSSHLTKVQKKHLKDLINNAVTELKKHFSKEGAYKLDSNFYLHDVINKFFGFNIDDLFITQVCHRVNVEYVYQGSSVYRNYTKKVFYNPTKNKLYIDTRARDVNVDLQLGDL